MSNPSENQVNKPPETASLAVATGSPSSSNSAVTSPLHIRSSVAHRAPPIKSYANQGTGQYQGFQHHPPRHQPYYGALSASSPQQVLPGYHEIGHAPAPYRDHHAVAIGHQAHGQPGQKRAYRQRRKDPSCDACRERKVKCDATDSSSCTECRGRNVTCQFTKETNRRMTSIKQNQDLSKELANAQAEISRLSSLLEHAKSDSSVDVHIPHEHLTIPAGHQIPNHNLMHLPVHESSTSTPIHNDSDFPDRPSKRQRLSRGGETERIVANMTRFGKGIFNSPYAGVTKTPATDPNTLPDLPSKDKADDLLYHYRRTIHPAVPVLHWKFFEEQYEAVYRDGSLRNKSSAFGALLFAIFACGTLHRSCSEGRKYLDESKKLMNSWTGPFILDHARAALLDTLFMVEVGLKSGAWVWLGIAARIGVDLGLHCDAGTWTTIEREIRRRVWWSIYACDSLLALEMGRTPMIKEEDCVIPLPNPVSDELMTEDNAWLAPTPDMKRTALLSTVHVVGPVARLFRIMKLAEIPQETLHIYDTHFERVLRSFPERQQHQNAQYASLTELYHVIYLQNARLILHRHNLNPSCDPKARSRSIENCAAVARSTAALVRKCMQEPSSSEAAAGHQESATWQVRVKYAASDFVCTHLWRCTLWLLHQRDFSSAKDCARFSQALADSRPVNIACNRYLDFFLAQLVQKMRQVNPPDNDEELLAYASGDMQADFQNSWIWQDRQRDSVVLQDAPGKPHSMAGDHGQALMAEDESEWAGWDKIVKLIDGLAREQQSGVPVRAEATPAEARPAPIRLPPLIASPSPSAASTPRERLSIKDLL